MRRGAAIGGLVLLLVGCESAEPAPERGAARTGARDAKAPGTLPAAARTSPGATTATAGVSARGVGVLRDEAPPQRRYRIVSDGHGGTRVVQDTDVLALPGAERPTRIPDPELPEPPPTPQEGPRVIETAPPR